MRHASWKNPVRERDEAARHTDRSARTRQTARLLLVSAAIAAVAAQSAAGAGKALVSLLFPTPASAATRDTHDLPPISSAKHAPRPLDIPKGDFRNLPPPKGAQGSTSAPASGPVVTQNTSPAPIDYSKSTVESRTARTDVYRNPDGTHTAVLHGYDANFKDGAGDWQPFDTTLTVADSSHHRVTSSPIGITFADDAGAPSLVALAGSAWSLSFGVEGAASGHAGSVHGNQERYATVAPGADLNLIATDQGVKANLVLNQAPPGTATPHWRFPLHLAGLTAVDNRDGTVSFKSADGATVLTLARGVAYDNSADSASGLPASTPVTTQLIGQGAAMVLDVSVDRGWLGATQRVYPVTIDPTFNAGNDSTVWDAYVDSATPNTTYDGAGQFDSGLQKYVDRIGYPVYPSDQDYSYLQWDLSPINGKHILGGQFRGYFFSGSGEFDMWRVANPWNSTNVTWNNKPNHTADRVQITTATTGTWTNVDITSWVINWAGGAWPEYGVSMDTAGTNNFWKMASSEDDTSIRPILVISYNTPPPASNPVSPTGNPTLTTASPTLTTTPVTDPDAGQTVSYDFRIATGSDAETGAVFNSGWITSTSYTVPAGFLQDGATYYWKVWTSDGTDVTSSAPSGSFTVNLRLGDQPSNPFDSAGPVDVNLATGNLEVKASSPSIKALGGDIGLSYTYNSQAQPEYGLRGSYWGNCSMPSPSMPPSSQPWGQRLDTTTSFNWNGGSPIPYVPGTNWCARWTGYITVPYASTDSNTNWFIGADSDDGVRVWVGGNLVLDRWYDQSNSYPNDFIGSTGFSTTAANQTLPITVDYYQHGGGSFLTLKVQGIVNSWLPVSWLSPTPPAMAQGWSLTGGDNQMLAYTSATITPQDVILNSPDGDEHEYVQTSSGSGNANAWTPMADGDAVLTQDASGNFVVHGEDGIVYTFNSLGKLTSAVTAVDDVHPAAAQFSWNSTTDRLDSVTDPVSGRSIRLTYQTDPHSSPPPNPTCPTASGFDSNAPTGELCLIRYPDGTQTNLYYLNGNLARIENWWSSGNQSNTEITDFGYDSSGRVVRVRTPLAADEVAAGLRSDDDSVRTVIAYDGAGRVASVTLPAPAASTDPHPQDSYSYNSATQTDVHVAGMTEPNGYARRVNFNAAGQITSDLDTAGNATTTTWDSGDRRLTTIDPAGLETTTVYDTEHRPTDQYGPAPSSCFSGQVPTGSCTNPAVPHATIAYDEGIYGLAALYYANTQLPSGAPSSHGTGVQDSSGQVNANWNTTPPPGLTGLTNWSARFTGEILLPSTGTYTFWTDSDDGSRLFIDDRLVVDYWSDHPMSMSAAGTFTNSTANSRHRIRLDYYQDQGGAGLQLYWQPPGGAQALVPGSDLFPRYGLTTSHVDADGKKTSTQYASPELSLPTAQISDPQGIALTSTTTYETVGSGYLRELQHTLPKGSATTVASSYYTSSDSAPSNQCGGGVSVGLLKQETGAAPASGSAIQHQYVYDGRGRILGLQVVGDSHWTCTAYDARGRVSSTTDSHGVTSSYDYSTPGTVTTHYTDSDGAARSTKSTVDLNGDQVSYVDEAGMTTTTTFDQAGRKTATYRQFYGQSNLQLGAWNYNSVGQLSSQTDYSSGSARVTTFGYDSAGRLLTETLPNGVVTTKTYDPNRGAVSGLSNKLGGTELSPWTYTYSGAGRIIQEVTTNRTRSFTYDSVGRLSRTVEGGTTRNYSYDADSNRCSTTTSCDSSWTYDNADRLTTSPASANDVYDAHGNLTTAVLGQAQVTNTKAGTVAPGSPQTRTSYLAAGNTYTASVDWQPSSVDWVINDSVNALSTKDYALPVSASGSISATLTWSFTAPTVPNLDLFLLDPNGNQVSSGTSLTNDWESVSWNATGITYPTSQTYTLRVKANDVGSSFTLQYHIPITTQMSLVLKDNAGHSVAQPVNASAKPLSLSYPVPTGQSGYYTLQWVPANYSNAHPTSYTETDNFPPTETLRYDGNDHATYMSDGTTETLNTLAPSGRVLRRVVKVNGTSTEDTTFDYAGEGDSPTESVPTGGSIVTTYVSGPDGLLLSDTGGQPSYSVLDLHGDVVGTTSASGSFTANPTTDEFGVGQQPSSHLGWLGGKERFTVGGGVALVQMGVRLYSPALGRFLQVDPVEGGSANDYDYVDQDPVNGFDLGGTCGGCSMSPDAQHCARGGNYGGDTWIYCGNNDVHGLHTDIWAPKHHLRLWSRVGALARMGWHALGAFTHYVWDHFHNELIACGMSGSLGAAAGGVAGGVGAIPGFLGGCLGGAATAAIGDLWGPRHGSLARQVGWWRNMTKFFPW